MIKKLCLKRAFSLAVCLIFCVVMMTFAGMTQVQADPGSDYSTDFSNGAGDWTANIGTWTVEDGEYSQSSTDYYDANSVITGRTFSDCIIEADLKLLQTDGAWGGINFRKTHADDGNASGYLLVCNVGGDFILLKDGATYLGTASTGISLFNTFVHVKIIANGSSIKVYVNNEATPRIDIVDTTYQSGYTSLNACFTHVHFDNVSISAISSDATLSDLRVNGTTVAGFAADTLTYDVVLAAGTTEVPTVMASVYDTGKATAVVTPASSLPGATTIVVTAQDGVTTRTYTVNFTVSAVLLFKDDFGAGVSDWTANLGTWAVEDGEYSQSSTSYYNASSVITEGIFSDCVIETDLKLMQTDGAWGGINFRKTNADDGNASGYLLVCNVGGDFILLKDGATYLGTAST